MTQQRNSAGGCERPQRCWATRTTGVPNVLPSEIYASGGGLLVVLVNAPRLFLKFYNRKWTLTAPFQQR